MAVFLPPKKKYKSPVGATPSVALFFMMILRLPFRYGFPTPPGGSGRFALSRQLFAVILILPFLSASACSPASTPTPFRPPTMQASLIEPTFIIHPTQEVTVVESTPLPTIVPTINPEECSNNLSFIEDLTIPDNMFTTFGLALDKQWLVENSGTCNWTSDYRLRHIGGAVLGAPEEIALHPARAGTQATIRILFTAPFTEGVYESAWQAMDATGSAFGDPIFISIVVQ
ncbi:MAG TPA: NBR1-Ig-like domain-containing protein [Anaerolineales bacterium]|nr:NBR1-Ig-like domain-containing protein [Anaerolineales bacterium]